MTFADDDPPLPPADLDRDPVGNSTKRRWHHRHTAAVALFAVAEQFARRLVKPGAAGKVAAQRAEIIAAPAHHPGVQPLLFGDPQRRPPALAKPAGKADMVGMEMGDEDPGHRAAVEMLGENPFPGGAGF